jgi:hypothetical protein
MKKITVRKSGAARLTGAACPLCGTCLAAA